MLGAARNVLDARAGAVELHLGLVGRARCEDQHVARPATACCAVGGVRRRESTITRSGCSTPSFAIDAGFSRGARRESGSSRKHRPAAREHRRRTARASDARRRAPRAPVIHWLVPFASAVRPSSVTAILLRTHGRPRRIRAKKPRFSGSAAFSSSAAVDADPGRLELARAAAVHARVRIAAREHHARDACLDQRLPSTAPCGP